MVVGLSNSRRGINHGQLTTRGGGGVPSFSTALYFPMAVTFMAATQGLWLNTGDYVIVALLSTLSTIGASPIPGSALVFVVMICQSSLMSSLQTPSYMICFPFLVFSSSFFLFVAVDANLVSRRSGPRACDGRICRHSGHRLVH